MSSTKFNDIIDKPTFFGSLFLLLAVTLPLVFFPEAGAAWVLSAKDFVTDQLGVLYLILGLGAFLFMVYITFSDIGQIKLGTPEENPEFSTFSWAAMLFCSGIGASILYWSMIEWAYYYQTPPFDIPGGTHEAAKWAVTYGIFHWGPLAWSIYLIPALPIAYFYYVRNHSVLKISEALMPVLGEERARGWLGKLIDVFFIFGMLGGGATTLGLAAPLINQGAHELLGVPNNLYTRIGVLIVCTAIFGYSAYAGLKKGIQMLSNINMWLAIGILLFIFVTGPTLFMLNTGLDSLGRMIGNLFEMATWTEPFAQFQQFPDTHFPQDWTIFYWAWWLVFAPSVGLFIARISKGRTIKAMVVGSIFFGTLGCFLFFMIMGNYGIYLQLSGQLDVISILNNQGATTAIFAMLHTLALSKLVVLAFTILAVIFTATTFDSISYILAAVVQKEIDEEPARWNRLFWAFALSVMPITLMFIGGLDTLQTASVIGGVPLLIVALLLCISIIRAAHFDLRYQPDYEDKEIYIEELPDDDPWTEEGSWDQEGPEEHGVSHDDKPHIEGDPDSHPSRL
ncbi:BCCT family transporter [Photobacterium halotolerans]|uniref:BCCT family transporter n=1 Tax=Photobacterium halotolerans TaxID=265726 RepID=A0A7X4WDU8_9GAMM|nr:BCCT family transporter [Photobacterium halotolerans]NAW66884.1 BCCT family transporter [Photobacterium halotolerans]